MISIETLNEWMTQEPEHERLEFKAAKSQFDTTKLMKYCVALANEKGGHLILGVTDKLPRKIVGTNAFANIADIKAKILHKLHFRVEVYELLHNDGRVLVFDIPSRPIGQALEFEGSYLMRTGESLVPMTSDQLRRIFSEGSPDWFSLPAKSNVNSQDVISLLDTQKYFELTQQPYPTSQEGVLNRFVSEKLIIKKDNAWIITNLAAILLAKSLSSFSTELARKSPRFLIYEGINKLHTREDKIFNQGYAVFFESLIDFVHSSAPKNYFIEEVLREEVKMFPRQALRELIANALVHQDFQFHGSSVMIEMYLDRIEISNPGIPSIKVDRFIDEYKSINETLADLMRRFHICDEKGSGIDKVIHAAEIYQLPAPDFRVGETRTTAILYAHQEFDKMNKGDRIRACYQHACLHYLSNNAMSNQTLRERFKLADSKMSTVSTIIKDTKDQGLIKPDHSDTSSTRYARYLPYWA